ncbi:hypothetical protein [Rufibacter psychrotolerans]|uniref:hypothetical protein n=1 Tax=Rufibacter psychrotolerans TaxID=2812556 RepID=UPI0019684E2A|nr:hypothetical protein [Rufibacter sp. SYSU D00308]
MTLNFQINPARIFAVYLKILVAVIFMSLVAVSLDYYFKNVEINKQISSSYTFNTYVVGMFDSNGEKNIPTYFSTVNLFACAFLLFLIARVVKASHTPTYHNRWNLLGFLFVFLALDELLMLHEIMGLPFIVLLKVLNGGQEIALVRFTGFIPYLLVLAISFFYFVNWFFSLPRQVMVGFMVAGSLVVFGAVGMELAGEYSRELFGKYSYPYKLLTTLEESLEMLGIIYFIRTLLVFLKLQHDALALKLNFTSSTAQQEAAAPQKSHQAVPKASKNLLGKQPV